MRHLHFFALSVLLFLAYGCSSDIGLREIGSEGRETYENTFVFSGGLSAETINTLGNNLLYDAFEDDPEKFIREMTLLCDSDPSCSNLIAMIETSQQIAASVRGEQDTAVGYDLATLIYSQEYFKKFFEETRTTLFDPDVIVAVKCYNIALTELFAYLQERSLHTGGSFELTASSGQTVHFEMPSFELPVAKEKIIAFKLCADFRPENLTHDSRKFGLGTPLVCELADNAIAETIFAEGQVIPATLIIHFSSTGASNRKNAKLTYIDSRSTDEIIMQDIRVPLAQDFSTPLAYMVKDPPVFDFLQRTFLIELTRTHEGLYHLEPHNDDRIPVVLVHGLMSGTRTWMQLINTLQSDPELRKHYRFMGFSYSSGNPIFISALHLRQALAAEREKLVKDGRNMENFDRMVLIGHSMGGMVSRLQISASNDEILSAVTGRETYFNSINHQDGDFRKIMIFSPSPMVKRVIFIAVPHRGSALANSMVGQMASSMIKIPKSLLEFNTKLFLQIVNLEGYDKENLMDNFNGIDNLSPSGMTVRILEKLPIASDIPYHSIIGNNKTGGVPGGTDGVVAYSSSHLAGAESELVVYSGHSVQQNPLAIREIKRILKEHLQQFE